MKGHSQKVYSRVKWMTEHGKMNSKGPTISFAKCIPKVKTKNILLTWIWKVGKVFMRQFRVCWKWKLKFFLFSAMLPASIVHASRFTIFFRFEHKKSRVIFWVGEILTGAKLGPCCSFWKYHLKCTKVIKNIWEIVGLSRIFNQDLLWIFKLTGQDDW